MLRDACVWTVSQAELLRRTIERNPSAANDIHTLCYSFRQAYVPIVYLAAPALFPKCRELTLRMDWSYFPSGYLGRIPHGSLGLTKLTLHIDGLTAGNFFRFVWSLIELRHLEIRGQFKLRKGEEGLSRMLSDILSRTKKASGCAKLEYLDIEGCSSTANFPPAGGFGTNVRFLALACPDGVSRNMLDCIGNFEQLATLKTKRIKMRPPRDRSAHWLRKNPPGLSFGPVSNPRPRCRYCGDSLHVQEHCPHRPNSILSNILACVRSGSKFRRLCIDLHPSHLISYHTTRSRLPELIFDEDTRAILHSLPGLEEIHLALDENDPRHNSDSWSTEVTQCLVGFGNHALSRASLFVTVRLRKGYMNYENLWLKEPDVPEVEDFATSVPEENIPSACIYHSHAYY
ncbi:hypothetical protein C8T65DRAFT_744779 [Cerioporus squamosus]|nr:hypothetical protein C8T65DRAFT_744779 [Cerioporus squamosus]